MNFGTWFILCYQLPLPTIDKGPKQGTFVQTIFSSTKTAKLKQHLWTHGQTNRQTTKSRSIRNKSPIFLHNKSKIINSESQSKVLIRNLLKHFLSVLLALMQPLCQNLKPFTVRTLSSTMKSLKQDFLSLESMAIASCLPWRLKTCVKLTLNLDQAVVRFYNGFYLTKRQL